MLKYINSLTVAVLLMITPVFASNSSISYVTHFNSQNYLGTWYEIARLPMFFEKNCIPPIKAHYEIESKNPSKILVTNSCARKEGGYDIAHGVAHFVETTSIGKLTVTFLPTYFRWLPFGHGAYWVIATDYTQYALVGSPNRHYLWILSRTENIKQPLLDRILSIAQSEGFSINRLILNNNSKK